MFTFHIIAIPDVLYLLRHNPTGPIMAKVFFGFPVVEHKIMEITDTALFPLLSFLRPFSLKLMWAEE